MIISLEEKDREVIEENGLYIIELKRHLYKMEKQMGDARKIVNDIVIKVAKALNALKDAFLEVVDRMKMYVEVIADIEKRPTSFRYKVVKLISKCTGVELHRIWKVTYRTCLARSSI